MPPKRIKTQDIPAYVLEHWGFSITRMTANNWITKGLRNETLHTVGVPNPNPTMRPRIIRTTTDVWIDEFLTRCLPDYRRVKR